MATDETATAQLRALDRIHCRFADAGVDYWLFGGWAVDFHAGRVTRPHADIDLVVWQLDQDRVGILLADDGWTHQPDAGEDGYTVYGRDDLRLEVALIARDADGSVHTPLVDGRGEWPAGSFGDDVVELEGVRARVVGRASLLEDKSGPRDDPVAAAKDRADAATLRSQPRRGTQG